MDRAYTTLTLKSLDADKGILEGIASTPAPDHDNDILDPLGCEYQLPLPLLWHHKQAEPIGLIHELTVSPTGIRIKAKVELGFGGRFAEAWPEIKAGLVRGLSVGFVGVESDPLPRGGKRYRKWQMLEVSAVTIPSNVGASILVVKSFANAARTGTKPHISASDLVRKQSAPLAAFTNADPTTVDDLFDLFDQALLLPDTERRIVTWGLTWKAIALGHDQLAAGKLQALSERIAALEGTA